MIGSPRLHAAALLLALAASAPARAGTPPAAAAELRYRFSYQIRGSASGKALIFVPFRVYYEAEAAVNLVAVPTRHNTWRFAWAGPAAPAFILRTLGFKGRHLAVLTAAADFEAGRRFGEQRAEAWKAEVPEYGRHVATVSFFPFRVPEQNRSALNFERDPQGVHRNINCRVEALYRQPQPPDIYFRVFPMMAELLAAYNHAPLPADTPFDRLPAEWRSPPLNFTQPLNGVAAQMEKIVAELVTLRQSAGFRMRYRLAGSSPEALEVRGEAQPNVSVWKGFEIRDCRRRLRLRPGDGAVLLDEIVLVVGNDKGQGGTGRLRLELAEQ